MNGNAYEYVILAVDTVMGEATLLPARVFVSKRERVHQRRRLLWQVLVLGCLCAKDPTELYLESCGVVVRVRYTYYLPPRRAR